MEEKKYLKWYNKVGFGAGSWGSTMCYMLITAFVMKDLQDKISDFLSAEIDRNELQLSAKIDAASYLLIQLISAAARNPALSFNDLWQCMLDVAISGNIFVAPEEDIAIKALELADKGKGVIFVVLNHEGDLLTGERATAACRARGIEVREIITQEDISSAPRSHGRDRRGLVGCILLYKIVGAAAAMGKSVEETAAVGQRFADQMATLTVGVRGATHPVTGKLLAEFGEDDM